MSENRLFIYHKDTLFRERFSAYLEKKTGGSIRCVCFEEETALMTALNGEAPFLLLAPEDFDFSIALRRQIPYLILTEGSERKREKELPLYRPMDRQMRTIRSFCKETSFVPAQGPYCRILGFYSPVHGAGQSVSAILSGLNLAEDQPALLLNLERCSGLKNLLPMGEGSLSDLLYYARVRGSIREHLPELTEYYGNLAFLAPVREEADLKEMKQEDWDYLLRQLREWGEYRVILMDMGEGVFETEALLNLCERIYVPLREDRLSQEKYREWQEGLSRRQGDYILSKLRAYRLPPEDFSQWIDYRELRLMSWGRCLKALLEAEL